MSRPPVNSEDLKELEKASKDFQAVMSWKENMGLEVASFELSVAGYRVQWILEREFYPPGFFEWAYALAENFLIDAYEKIGQSINEREDQ